MERALFRDAPHAIETMFSMQARLAGLVMWCLIWLGHLTVLMVILLTLWATGWEASALWTVLQLALTTRTASVLGFLGLSALGIATFYWRLIRWVQGAPGRDWLYRYLTKALRSS